MKKTIYRVGLLVASAAIFTFSSCTKDPDVKPEEEQEEFDDIC